MPQPERNPTDRPPLTRPESADFLRGGGEMGELIRLHDWQASPLGPPEAWPQTLRTAVRLLLNSGHPMYIWWGPQLLCFYNDAYRQSIGPEQHPSSLGQPARQVWQEIWPIIGPQIEQVMSGGGATWHENALVPITRNGVRQDVYWTYSYSPIDDTEAAAGVGGVLVVCTETTASVLAARRRSDELRNQRRLFEQAPGFISVMRGPEHVVEFNNAAHQTVFHSADWIGKPIREAIPSLAGQGFFELLDHVYATGETYQGKDVAVRFRRSLDAAEETRYLTFIYAPLIDEDQRVAGVFCEGFDGTDGHRASERLLELNETLEQRVSEAVAKRAEALRQLHDSENLFRSLVDSVTDYAIFRLDLSGRITSWNAGAKRIKGYSADEIIGRHLSHFYTPEDQQAGVPEAALRRAERDGRSEAEGWRVRKDGSRFWASVVIDGIYEEGELVGFAKVTRDITERREAEGRLRQAQKMEAIGQFTGGAAHDFNNLLAAILGSLGLVRRHLPDNPKVHGLLDNAMLAAKRGATLTQRMLAFARRQELKIEAVDPFRLISEIRDLLERSVGAHVAIETQVPTGIASIRTDANQLETALLNLVGNARDAMPEGGRIVIAAREVRVDASHPAGLDPGQYVCLSVSDTGQGMNEATLARVAEPFFTTKGIGKGTGLGLAMVDGLAAQSGGGMTITSRVGHGTTVELWLQVAGADLISVDPARTSETFEAVPGARRLQVLVVDDDGLVLMNLVAMLEELGHVVIGAASGDQALNVLDANPAIELVVSDQAMPGMTGMQLVEAIKARRPDLPVILASGFAELPQGDQASVRRLSKPFNLQELAEAVNAAVRIDPST